MQRYKTVSFLLLATFGALRAHRGSKTKLPRGLRECRNLFARIFDVCSLDVSGEDKSQLDENMERDNRKIIPPLYVCEG